MATTEWPTPQQPHHGSFIVRQVEFLRRAGVTVEVFPIRGRRHPLKYAAAAHALHQRCARGGFDLLHAQFGHCGALAALVTRQPLVVTFHGSDVLGIARPGGGYHLASPLLRGLSALAARRAAQAVVVTAALAARLPPRRYHILPCGIDLEHFVPQPQAQARATLGLPAAGPLVLFGGNPAMPVKRYALAQAAMREVQAQLPAQLIVVQNTAPQRMPLYMNACDALLLTSLHEGSPNVVKEALACNLPVVAVRVGDVADRLQHVHDCIVTDDAAPATLAAALVHVLTPTRRCRGRPHVAAFDERRTISQLVQIYAQAAPDAALPPGQGVRDGL